MKATFENSLSVLVRAYMNDTLEHSNCYACAVGNLVVAAMGYSHERDFLDGELVTREAIANREGEAGANWFEPLLGRGKLSNECRKEIAATGYTIHQIKRIERAFEGVEVNDDRMFNGLMAVVDVLAEIHGVDLSVREQAKLQFVKA